METTSTNRIPTSTNEALILFYNKILATDGQRFQIIDVVNFVAQYNFGTTKETLERSLRNLRAQSKINYTVVNRKQGIFQALPVVPEASVAK